MMPTLESCSVIVPIETEAVGEVLLLPGVLHEGETKSSAKKQVTGMKARKERCNGRVPVTSLDKFPDLGALVSVGEHVMA